jgi:hypothetical protein
MHKHANHDFARLSLVLSRAETQVMSERISHFAQQTADTFLGRTAILTLSRRLVPVHALAVRADSRRWHGRVGPSCSGHRHLAEGFPDHFGREKEVIVVHNDQVAGAVQLGHLLRKELVCFGIGDPAWVRGGNCGGRVEPEEVVEQGPESYSSVGCSTLLRIRMTGTKTHSFCKSPHSGPC